MLVTSVYRRMDTVVTSASKTNLGPLYKGLWIVPAMTPTVGSKPLLIIFPSGLFSMPVPWDSEFGSRTLTE